MIRIYSAAQNQFGGSNQAFWQGHFFHQFSRAISVSRDHNIDIVFLPAQLAMDFVVVVDVQDNSSRLRRGNFSLSVSLPVLA